MRLQNGADVRANERTLEAQWATMQQMPNWINLKFTCKTCYLHHCTVEMLTSNHCCLCHAFSSLPMARLPSLLFPIHHCCLWPPLPTHHARHCLSDPFMGVAINVNAPKQLAFCFYLYLSFSSSCCCCCCLYWKITGLKLNTFGPFCGLCNCSNTEGWWRAVRGGWVGYFGCSGSTGGFCLVCKAAKC